MCSLYQLLQYEIYSEQDKSWPFFWKSPSKSVTQVTVCTILKSTPDNPPPHVDRVAGLARWAGAATVHLVAGSVNWLVVVACGGGGGGVNWRNKKSPKSTLLADNTQEDWKQQNKQSPGQSLLQHHHCKNRFCFFEEYFDFGVIPPPPSHKFHQQVRCAWHRSRRRWDYRHGSCRHRHRK